MRKQYKLKANGGIRVMKVFPHASAQAAGIRVSDVIVQLDDPTNPGYAAIRGPGAAVQSRRHGATDPVPGR